MSERLPDRSLNAQDKGDDTQRRYRFQAAYAASLSLLLYDPNSEYEEIFCEHYEDILVKLKNAQFIGVQVKTREIVYGPFRFNDNEIMKSLARFVELEMNFPNVFKNYVICTNCGFLNRKDASSLSRCLEIVKKYKGSKECLEEIDFSQRLKELSKLSRSPEDSILAVLNKVDTVNWADLTNYEKILVHDIATYTENRHQPYDVLQRIAEELIGIAFRAAALSHTLSQPSYYELLKDPQKAIFSSVLQNKRITSLIVQNSINQCLKSTVTLQGVAPIQISALPKGMNVMELKMAKGAISYSNVALMKDLNASAQKLLIEWLHIHGKIKADQRAEHLRLLVQNECQEAHDLADNSSKPYGNEMLQAVRDRLRKKYEKTKLPYPECCYEHLVGIAGILTEDCKVWWSEEFEIPRVGI